MLIIRPTSCKKRFFVLMLFCLEGVVCSPQKDCYVGMLSIFLSLDDTRITLRLVHLKYVLYKYFFTVKKRPYSYPTSTAILLRASSDF